MIWQVFPRSLEDGAADGIGDLPGIEARLPYPAALGVDAVWLSPFCPSPMADFWYDVSDYCDVDSILGTLDDVDSSLERVHDHGLKLIFDFMPTCGSTLTCGCESSMARAVPMGGKGGHTGPPVRMDCPGYLAAASVPADRSAAVGTFSSASSAASSSRSESVIAASGGRTGPALCPRISIAAFITETS